MRFFNFDKIQADGKKDIDLIAGVYKGEPLYMARQNSAREWGLYHSDGLIQEESRLEQEAGNFQTLDEVLVFYRLKGFTPFCPKPAAPEPRLFTNQRKSLLTRSGMHENRFEKKNNCRHVHRFSIGVKFLDGL